MKLVPFFLNVHYYRTGLCSRPFVPVAFGPGTIGGFCPGSKGTTTDRAICPGSKGLFVPVLEPGQGRRDKSAGGFCPGWYNRDKMSLALKKYLRPAGLEPKTYC